MLGLIYRKDRICQVFEPIRLGLNLTLTEARLLNLYSFLPVAS